MTNNINFFIDIKLRISDELNSLNKIIEKNNEVATLTDLSETEIEILNRYREVSNAITINRQIEKLENLLCDVTKHIEEICRHEFENDYIELGLGNMKLICYCKICGSNI